jgi:hypothetical protein
MDTESKTDAIPTAHTGSCHCGAVRFQAELDLSKGGTRCNCSVCTKLGITGALVKPAAFKLVAGGENLSTYQWGAKIGTRHFCKLCGVFVFVAGHLPEVGGDFVSVNLNCLDEVDVDLLPVIYWDGRHDNWDAGPRSTPWPRLRAESRAA